MRTSLTRAAAGVAVTAATVLALAGPAHAGPAPAREHTTLSIVESRSVIKEGQTAVVRGTLAHGKTGLGAETVLLDHFVGGTLVLVRSGLTGPAGGVAFTVDPSVTSRYELVFAGTTTLAPSHSGIVTLRVIAPPPPVREHTTLSIVESRSVIKAGQTAVVRGTLAHAGTGLAAETVYLDKFVGGTLVLVRSGLTGPAGGVAFTVAPGVTARFELVFKGTATLAPSHSGIVTLKVIA
jgi:energy-converting hydrogenase Eha subunit A